MKIKYNNKDFNDLIELVEYICEIKIPEPELLWEITEGINKYGAWGYISNGINPNSKKNFCYVNFIPNISNSEETKKKKKDAKLDLARVICFGRVNNKDFSGDEIIFPEIKIQKEKVKQIRKIAIKYFT